MDNSDSYYIRQFGPDAKNDFAPHTYDRCYHHLRRWIEASLDVFKPQLKDILFPLFTHIYLDLLAKNYVQEARAFLDSYKADHVAFYSHDLFQMDAVQTPHHVTENAWALAVRDPNNKFTVTLHDTTFRLLISYLEDNNMVALLRILSQYIQVNVISSTAATASASASASASATTSSALAAAPTADATSSSSSTPAPAPASNPEKPISLAQFNSTPLRLGPPLLPTTDRQLIESALTAAANKDPAIPPDNKGLYDDHVTPIKPVPLPPLRAKHVQEYVDHVQDLAHRATLSSTALPSIAMYTWHNTYDALTCATRLVGHQAGVFAVRISPDKRFLVSGSEDGTARLWSLDTFSNVAVYRGHNYPVWDVDIGTEGHYFATASHDRTARLWSPEYIFPLRIFAGHLSDVDVVRFHPNSSYVATGSADKTVRLWDVQTGNHVRVLTGHAGAVQALAFSPDGKSLAVAGEDKHVHVWDLGEGKRIKKMASPEGTKSVVTSLVWSQEGSLLDASEEVASATAAASATAEKRKTKATSNDLLETFWTLRTPVTGLVFTRRNLLLATGAYNPTLP
ncbi:WD40-repeat-containing domain protein [Catenaria anguillulae PL171]|uniref:WD40-repeat-containing domain protein n=1 Tax=Catenaria anguillulae PL171 TaxID=765915 RepID=A0A1Y2HA87_9FUNG|nr:WD40-repeat-containing domain protein [Catenaria anguillulae PL171]